MPDIDIDYSRACLLGECGPYPNPNMTYADTLNTYSGSGNVGSSSGKFPASGDGGCPPMAGQNLVGQAMKRALSQSLTEEKLYWQSLLGQLHRPEDTYLKYIIGQILSGVGKQYSQGTLRSKAPPDVPEWMKPYLVGSEEEGERDIRRKLGKDREKARTPGQFLRPLGAQEELDADKLGFMASYLGWQMEGAPTSAPLAPAWQYSALHRAKLPTHPMKKAKWQSRIAGLLGGMGDWQRHFQQYQGRSTSLFPTQANLASRFRIATQR